MSFKQLTPDNIVTGNPSEVTLGIWSGDTGSLSSFYTSSAQISGSLSGQYYVDVYNINPSSSNAEQQFAVAYGNRLGGGNQSLAVNNNTTLSTEAIYSQYRNLLLVPGTTQFTVAGNVNIDQIYVLNVYRARLKETLDPGNWQLTLSGSSGSFTFIDDSGQTLGSNFGHTGAVFNVVSGSLSGSAGFSIVSASGSNAALGGFGLVYPSLGIIVLNPQALQPVVGLVSASYLSGKPFAPNTDTNNTQYNHLGLLNSIALGGNFQARSSETISSTHYFVGLGPNEFNYSNNPTFFDESSGNILNTDFINNPVVYVTTVGLYDNDNELLAVAKLSKSVQKTFGSVVNLSVRLDW